MRVSGGDFDLRALRSRSVKNRKSQNFARFALARGTRCALFRISAQRRQIKEETSFEAVGATTQARRISQNEAKFVAPAARSSSQHQAVRCAIRENEPTAGVGWREAERG